MIELEVHTLRDYPEFDKFSHIEEYECVFRKKEMAMKNLFSDTYNYYMAGRDDNCLGMIFEIIFSEDACSQNPNYKTAITFCRDYFSDLYDYDNILGVFINDKEIPSKLCFYIFPLNGRTLTPSAWIDINKKVRLSRKSEFLSNLIKELDLKEKNKTEDKENLPYLNRIDEYIPKVPRVEEDDNVSIYETHSVFSNMQTTLSKTLIAKRFEETLRYFTGTERRFYTEAQAGNVTWDVFRERILEYLKKYHHGLSALDIEYITKKMYSAVYGYYILDDLIADETISDIKIISWNNIRVKVGSGRFTSNLTFLDEEDLRQFLRGVASRHRFMIDRDGIFVFTDKETSDLFRMRFNLTTPYINSNESYYLHIRKIRKDKYSIEDLIKYQMMPRKVADFLIEQAKVSKGLIFCGKGASGKTTLMNVLLEKYPYNKSGLVVQESEELFSDNHPDMMFQHITELYNLQGLSKNGLLTDLDLFVIGEIKGAEAMYFLNACATGHQCWCSVHASSSLNAIDKLADYVMYESKYDKIQAEEMLKDLETIVFMKNFKVEEISQITGWDRVSQHLTYRTLYKRVA